MALQAEHPVRHCQDDAGNLQVIKLMIMVFFREIHFAKRLQWRCCFGGKFTEVLTKMVRGGTKDNFVWLDFLPQLLSSVKMFFGENLQKNY